MAKETAAALLSIEGREIRITNPDKPYFSRGIKLSKLDLVRYYLGVAPGAVAGIRNRPIVLKRFVNGAEAEPFYQKRAPDKRPDWLRTVTLSLPSGRTAEEVVVDDAAGLAWIVNLGCIELHPHAVIAVAKDERAKAVPLRLEDPSIAGWQLADSLGEHRQNRRIDREVHISELLSLCWRIGL